jgi:predicted GNAT family acetyltransferase
VSDAVVRDNPEEARYEVYVDEAIAGFVAYRRREELVTMIHTEVEPEWEGHGLGSQLVRGALDDVRSRGLKVRPLCPFVAAYIARHPEYRDIVA